MTPPTTVDSYATHHEHHNNSLVAVREDNADQSPIYRDSALASLSAVSRPNINGKRHADGNESGGEDDDRGKFQRTSKQPNELIQNDRAPCPFHIRYPDRHDFKKCGTWKNWKALREHLVSRTHRPLQQQCSNCGKCFDNEKWDEHTRARKCQKRPRKEFEELICMTRDQETKIRALVTQGRRKAPFEELWRDVWDILFKGKSCTTFQYSNDANESQNGTQSSTDPHTLLGDQNFVKTISTLPGMENVSEKDRGNLAIECWIKVQRFIQPRSTQAYVNVAETQAALAEHAMDDAVQGPRNQPSSSGVQASRISASNSFRLPNDMTDMLGVLFPDSHLFDGESGEREAGVSSSPSQYVPGPSGIIETVPADLHHGTSVHKFYSNPPCVNPAVLRNPNPQPTETSSSNHNSSQRLPMPTGLPSSPVEHQDNMTTLSDPSRSQYLGHDGCTNDGDVFDPYLFEFSKFDNDGTSEQD